MNSEEQPYNVATIRELLLAAFTPEELRRFCQDRTHFRPILNDFGLKYSLNDMVYEVIVYCHANRLFDELLSEIEGTNPRQYAQFKEQLHTPDPHTYDAFIAKEIERRPPTLGKFVRHIKQAIAGDSETQRTLRNRQAMLRLVTNTWVKGVLEQSLHGAAMIQLGMEKRSDAVEQPWNMVMQMPGQPRRQLPHGTTILDVFEGASQKLLILGEPGSGKTTMLLALARSTITRAEQDPTEPIPVVFNLSSWAVKQLPIAEWLVEELNTKYHLPKRFARPWVDEDALLLLLDGLDEVKPELRDACVRAFITFRREHLMPLAICCRTAEYEALSAKLELEDAVLLQPLTPAQIDAYLTGTGVELLAVSEIIHHDPVLQELAQSPLMLSIMTLAYRGMSIRDLGPFHSIDSRRQHVLSTYVQRMFGRRGADQPYSPKQTLYWLVWLASKMSQYGQTTFLIERLQPVWLQPARWQRLHAALVSLILGLYCGLIGGLIAMLPLWSDSSFLFGSIAGLVIGCLLGQILAVFEIAPVEIVVWSWANASKGLVLAWLFVLWIACNAVFDRLGGGLTGALFPSWPDLSPLYLVGLSTVIPVVAIASLLGLGSGLLTGVGKVTVQDTAVPNQGIHKSAKNSTSWGLVYGLAFGLAVGLLAVSVAWYYTSWLMHASSVGQEPPGGFAVFLSGWLSKPSNILLWELACGLGGVAVGTLWLGGIACVQHITLRYVLWRKGDMPWRYASFLDHATERIFLRKVGGGYIFVHRLLQDYFSSLETAGEGRE